jgi:AraC-like DNA-binding protein
MKNQLRVEYAKELLSDELMNNLTIDAIGQKSGFSTRSNFYNTFKVETGCTPSEYLKSIKLEKNILDS